MTPDTLLANALERIESKSIRLWAMSPHNRMVWATIAAKWLDSPGRIVADDSDLAIRFATYIMCVAMG